MNKMNTRNSTTLTLAFLFAFFIVASGLKSTIEFPIDIFIFMKYHIVIYLPNHPLNSIFNLVPKPAKTK